MLRATYFYLTAVNTFVPCAKKVLSSSGITVSG